MKSLSVLIFAVAATVAPLPVLAQTWPATVVAGAPAMTAPGSSLTTLARKDERATGLRLAASLPSGEGPKVDIKPKAEWSDGAGLRMSPTRIAYKRRF